MEADLIIAFHISRIRQIAKTIVEEMTGLRPGGLFDGRARCRNLWDEACFALQESHDEQAVWGAEMTVMQFCTGHVAEMSTEELRLHCYTLTDDVDDDGMPFAIADAVSSDLAQTVTEIACSRNLSSLEVS